MSSNPRRVIPREELSGFQRWQFGSLLDSPPAQPAPEVAESVPDAVDTGAGIEVESIYQEGVQGYTQEETPSGVVEAPALPYPTAEEIEAIQQQAHDEGYQAGLQAGREQAVAEVQRMQELVARMSDWLTGAERELAEEVLDLSLTIARQVVRDELHADRTVLMAGIREVLAALPAVRSPARMLLNPDDLVLLQSDLQVELPEDVWRLVPDPSLPAGGCRIETPASSVDISLATRWQNQLAVLRRDDVPALAWEYTAAVPADSDKRAVSATAVPPVSAEFDSE